MRTAGGGSTGSVRNLRIREDTAKYLLNLDTNSGMRGGALGRGRGRLWGPGGGRSDAGRILGRSSSAVWHRPALNLTLTLRTAVPPIPPVPHCTAAYYDPKSRSMREDPTPDKDPSQKTFYGDNFVRQSGEVGGFRDLNGFSVTTYERGQDVHMQVCVVRCGVCSVRCAVGGVQGQSFWGNGAMH